MCAIQWNENIHNIGVQFQSVIAVSSRLIQDYRFDRKKVFPLLHNLKRQATIMTEFWIRLVVALGILQPVVTLLPNGKKNWVVSWGLSPDILMNG